MFQTLAIFIKRVELHHDKPFVAHAMQEVLQLGEVDDIRFIHRLDDQQRHRYNAAVVTFKRWADTPSPQRLFNETRHGAAKVYYNPKRFWYITEHKPTVTDQLPDQLAALTHQQLVLYALSKNQRLQHMTEDNARLRVDNLRLHADNLRLQTLAEDPHFAETLAAQQLDDARQRHALAELDAHIAEEQHQQQMHDANQQLAHAIAQMQTIQQRWA